MSGTLTPGDVPGVSRNLLQATKKIYLDEKANIHMFLLLFLLTMVFTRKTLSEVSQKNQQGHPMFILKCLQVSRGCFEKPWQESLIRGQTASVGLPAPSFINFVACISYLKLPEAQFLPHSKGSNSVFFIGLLRRGLELRIHRTLRKGPGGWPAILEYFPSYSSSLCFDFPSQHLPSLHIFLPPHWHYLPSGSCSHDSPFSSLVSLDSSL